MGRRWIQVELLGSGGWLVAELDEEIGIAYGLRRCASQRLAAILSQAMQTIEDDAIHSDDVIDDPRPT